MINAREPYCGCGGLSAVRCARTVTGVALLILLRVIPSEDTPGCVTTTFEASLPSQLTISIQQLDLGVDSLQSSRIFEMYANIAL
jgi:hypothetical protein